MPLRCFALQVSCKHHRHLLPGAGITALGCTSALKALPSKAVVDMAATLVPRPAVVVYQCMRRSAQNAS